MKLYELAGCRLSIEGAAEERMLEDPAMGFVPFARCEGAAEWHVRYGGEVSLPEFVSDHEFDIADGGIRCRVGSGEGSLYLEMLPPGNGRPLRLRYDGGSTIESSPADSRTLLRYSLWTAVGMLGLKAGMQPIHSSAVVCGGRAVLFLGESGTGKSTQTRLWQQHIGGSRLLNDDSPLLTMGGEVYGSPWSGKTPCYEDRHFPVAAIVRIVQARENRMCRIDILESIGAVMPSLPPALGRTALGLEGQLTLAARLVEQVPVFRLECLPDEEAARLCHDTIFWK